MKREKTRKDIVRQRNKLRKRQQMKAGQTGADTAENDCGISEESAKRLKQKMREMSGIEHEIIRDSTLEKMSDILLDYAEPFLNTIDSDNKDEYENAIMMAMAVWNCSVMGDTSKGRRKIRKLMKPIMSEGESRRVVQYMLERKRQMYPDNKRMMMNYELTEMPDGGFHLSVASTVDEATVEKHIKSLQNKT
ncbi:MAG: hypothetical protein LBK75_11505 [Oscillospiraceae bacterium]|jgi:hypothetical protein|nr:hypothetical protein [Oscillospiraceae bacterium]